MLGSRLETRNIGSVVVLTVSDDSDCQLKRHLLCYDLTSTRVKFNSSQLSYDVIRVTIRVTRHIFQWKCHSVTQYHVIGTDQ